MLLKSRRQAGDIAEWVGGDAGANVCRAQLFEYRLHRLEHSYRERIVSFWRYYRVEHERFHVLGVAFGVLECPLGAVGDAEQHKLFVAGGLADRLDVGY